MDLALTILLQAKDTASSVVKNLGGLLKSLGGGDVTGAISGVGTVLLGVGAVTLGIGAASVQAAGDFQQSMLKVQALAAPATEDMKAMSAAILQMAPAVGQGPTKLAEGLYFVESAGIHGKAAIDLLRLSAEAASSGGIKDMSVVTDAATSAMNAFKDGSVTAQKAVDIFTATVSAGKMQAQDYAGAVSVLASGTANGRAQWVEANAALAVFTRTGETARVASQHLGALIQFTGTQAEKMAGAATKMHLQFDVVKFKALDLAGKMQYLHDVTGGNFAMAQKLLGGNKTLAATYSKLYDNTSSYNDILGQLKTSAGATDTAFATTSQGFNASMDRMNAAFDVLKITIGQALIPAITAIVTAITPVITMIATWITQNHLIEKVLGAVKVVIAAVVGVVGGLATAFNNVTQFFQQNQDAATLLLIPLGILGGYFVYLGVTAVVAFIAAAPAMIAGFIAGAAAAWTMAAGVIAATWPFILIGVAIAAVVAIVILVIKHWSTIVTWFAGVWRATWGGVSSFFTGVWTAIATFVSGVWQNISNTVVRAATAVATFFVGVWQKVVGVVRAIWNVIVLIFQVALRVLLVVVFGPILLIAALFVWLYNQVPIFRQLCDAIVGFFRAALAWLVTAWRAFTTWLTGVWTAIASVATTIWTAITGAITTAVKAVAIALTIAWNAVATFLASVWKAISGAVTVAWNAVATFLASVWATISKALTIAWNAVVTFLAGIWQKVSSALTIAWNAIVVFFGGIWANISKALTGAWDGIVKVLQGVWNKYLAKPLGDLGNAITKIFDGVWKGITNGFKGVINWIISGINSFIDALNSVHISLPAIDAGPVHLPGVDISFPHLNHIPLLAKGGDILRGGLAIVGERGPELLNLPAGARVRPLDRSGASAGGGTTINHITINAGNADAKAVYAMVLKELTRDLRRSGNLVTMTSGGRS